jgi:hypothetical protein
MVRRSTWTAAKAPFDLADALRQPVSTGPICRRHPWPPVSYCALIHGYYWSLLAERHLTLRLFAGMLAEIAMLPSPAGWGERRVEQFSMTALVWREECLRMRPRKRSFRSVACSPEAEPVPSGAAGNTVGLDGVKPCQRKALRCNEPVGIK